MILVGDSLHNDLLDILKFGCAGIQHTRSGAQKLAVSIAPNSEDVASQKRIGNLSFKVSLTTTFNSSGGLAEVDPDGGICVGTAAQSNAGSTNILLLLAFSVGQVDRSTNGQFAVNSLVHANNQLTSLLVDTGTVNGCFYDFPLDVVKVTDVVAQFRCALHNTAVVAIQEHFALVGSHTQLAAYTELSRHNFAGAVIRNTGSTTDGKDVVLQAVERITCVSRQTNVGNIGINTLENIIGINMIRFPSNDTIVLLSFEGCNSLLAHNRNFYFSNVEVSNLLFAGDREHSINHITLNGFDRSTRHLDRCISHGIAIFKGESDFCGVDCIGQETAIVVQFGRQAVLQPFDAALANLVNADRGSGRNTFNRLGHLQRYIQRRALHSVQSGSGLGAGIVRLALYRHGDALAGIFFINRIGVGIAANLGAVDSPGILDHTTIVGLRRFDLGNQHAASFRLDIRCIVTGGLVANRNALKVSLGGDRLGVVAVRFAGPAIGADRFDTNHLAKVRGLHIIGSAVIIPDLIVDHPDIGAVIFGAAGGNIRLDGFTNNRVGIVDGYTSDNFAVGDLGGLGTLDLAGINAGTLDFNRQLLAQISVRYLQLG